MDADMKLGLLSFLPVGLLLSWFFIRSLQFTVDLNELFMIVFLVGIFVSAPLYKYYPGVFEKGWKSRYGAFVILFQLNALVFFLVLLSSFADFIIFVGPFCILVYLALILWIYRTPNLGESSNLITKLLKIVGVFVLFSLLSILLFILSLYMFL